MISSNTAFKILKERQEPKTCWLAYIERIILDTVLEKKDTFCFNISPFYQQLKSMFGDQFNPTSEPQFVMFLEQELERVGYKVMVENDRFTIKVVW